MIPRLTRPAPVTDLEFATGLATPYASFPLPSQIPPEYWRDSNPWLALVRQIRDVTGLGPSPQMSPRDGIDTVQALRFLGAALQTESLRGQAHVLPGCAYLLSLWFKRVELFTGHAAEAA